MFINWTDKGMVVFHGLIGIQMHLEFLRNIKFKWENERPMGIAHILLFILQ